MTREWRKTGVRENGTGATMKKIRPGESTVREILKIGIPALLLVIIVFLVAYHYVQPAPPRTIVMTTGMEGRTYATLGERYKQILARSDVTLQLQPSSGVMENLARLKDKSGNADVGFLQGGTSSSTEAPELVSLGSISYNPLWVFYRGKETLDDFSQLKGKRIAIGPETSGGQKLALSLLKTVDAANPPTTLISLADKAATQALNEGRIDVVITLGTADNIHVQELLHSQNIKLMNCSQAEAYTRRFPALSHVTLPKGIVDPAKRLPASDVHLLAATTSLVVRDTMHPALMYLLLDAAAEIHGRPGWVNKQKEFPASTVQDFPLSDQAERFYRSGPPFLLDYLPFWVAVLLDRIIKILLPVLVVLLPLARIMPWLYSWRNRSELYRWYGELKYLELEVSEHPQHGDISGYYARLDRIETSVSKTSVPRTLYNELYTLIHHIETVRERIARLEQKTGRGSTPVTTDVDKPGSADLP
jgi:TRAP-type uncharacterized transport system substrate-binding protein